MATYSHPDSGVFVSTGGDDPVSGKVMVAWALRSSSPLRSVIRASHGPAGIPSSNAIVTASVLLAASSLVRIEPTWNLTVCSLMSS